jgi:hypothetical protein
MSDEQIKLAMGALELRAIRQLKLKELAVCFGVAVITELQYPTERNSEAIYRAGVRHFNRQYAGSNQ